MRGVTEMAKRKEEKGKRQRPESKAKEGKVRRKRTKVVITQKS